MPIGPIEIKNTTPTLNVNKSRLNEIIKAIIPTIINTIILKNSLINSKWTLKLSAVKFKPKPLFLRIYQRFCLAFFIFNKPNTFL